MKREQGRKPNNVFPSYFFLRFFEKSFVKKFENEKASLQLDYSNTTKIFRSIMQLRVFLFYLFFSFFCLL